MEAVGGAVKADISGDRPGFEPRIERLWIGALKHEAAGDGFGEKGAARHVRSLHR